MLPTSRPILARTYPPRPPTSSILAASSVPATTLSSSPLEWQPHHLYSGTPTPPLLYYSGTGTQHIIAPSILTPATLSPLERQEPHQHLYFWGHLSPSPLFCCSSPPTTFPDRGIAARTVSHHKHYIKKNFKLIKIKKQQQQTKPLETTIVKPKNQEDPGI
jgi:hypothetical protein